MLQNVEELKKLLASDGDLAVHTWSHRYTTSLSNEEVAGELGWTMQLIYNSTGGKVSVFVPHSKSRR
jgi:peptidoglycan/xylan/chitin deacetylase (PgdA/CDA1 family)